MEMFPVSSLLRYVVNGFVLSYKIGDASHFRASDLIFSHWLLLFLQELNYSKYNKKLTNLKIDVYL